MSGLAPFETSIAERYHEETKYSEDGLRRDALRFGPPDAARRPSPYKVFDGFRVPLPTDGLPLRRPGDAPAHAYPRAPSGLLDLAKIARILWHTNGCTLFERFPGGVQAFRAAPSAGAMYPTEVYVALRNVAGIPPGIYDYQVTDHSLALVHAADAIPAIHGAAFGHPAAGVADAVVILTGEWYRSSWRYRERGYRRALLDTGHVLGNLVECAPSEGFTAVPVSAFRDDVIERLLGVDPASEGPLALVPLVAAEKARDLAAIPQRRSPVTEWHRAMAAVGDRTEPDAPERIIAAYHLASRLVDTAEPVERHAAAAADARGAHVVSAAGRPTSWSAADPVTDTIARRRSTRSFAPAAVPKAALARALAHAYHETSEHLFAPELLETHLVAHDVSGLPAGSYLYDAGPRRFIERTRGDFAKTIVHLGLGQEIFVNAAAALIHAVDLTRAVERYGDRAYRLALLDAGHIGERLALALLREGFGSSGCGGYFDDEMNRVLQFPESRAVVYITAIGAPGS